MKRFEPQNTFAFDKSQIQQITSKLKGLYKQDSDL
jgi:hypothetical protein